MKTAEILNLPLEVLEIELRKDPTIANEINCNKEKVEGVLNDNFRKIAIKKKAEAIWTTMADRNIHDMLSGKDQVLAILFKQNGGEIIPAWEMLKTLDYYAYFVHNCLLDEGFAYENLNCEEEVKGAIYEMSIPLSDKDKILDEIDKEGEAGLYTTTDSLATGILKKLGAHYWAKHVVLSYQEINAN